MAVLAVMVLLRPQCPTRIPAGPRLPITVAGGVIARNKSQNTEYQVRKQGTSETRGYLIMQDTNFHIGNQGLEEQEYGIIGEWDVLWVKP